MLDLYSPTAKVKATPAFYCFMCEEQLNTFFILFPCIVLKLAIFWGLLVYLFLFALAFEVLSSLLSMRTYRWRENNSNQILKSKALKKRLPCWILVQHYEMLLSFSKSGGSQAIIYLPDHSQVCAEKHTQKFSFSSQFNIIVINLFQILLTKNSLGKCLLDCSCQQKSYSLFSGTEAVLSLI